MKIKVLAEMNIFVPQSYESKAECEEILGVTENFMSGQDSKPMLSIKQDGMTGGYKLTFGRVSIPVPIFNDCLMFDDWDMDYIWNKMEHIKKVHKWCGLLDEEIKSIKENLVNDKLNSPSNIVENKKEISINPLQEELNKLNELVKQKCKESATFKRTKEYKTIKQQILKLEEQIEEDEDIPDISNLSVSSTDLSVSTNFEFNEEEIRRQAEDNLLYTGHSLFSMLLPDDFEYFCDNGMSPDGKPVQVTRGVLISGTLNKVAMGNASGSLIHHIAKDYGKKRAVDFVGFYQMIINNWLQHFGHTISVADCIPHNVETIERELNKCLLETESVMKTEDDKDFLEMKISCVLNKAATIGQKLAKEALSSTNNFVTIIRSGAKGDFFNITQVTGIVGQQSVSGRRIPKTFAGRTLPHFVKTGNFIDSPDLIYFGDNDEQDKIIPDEYKINKLVESRGFVKSSYFKGLNPAEFFFHAAGGREGLIDTACKTALTGYIQRKITKMVEDLKWSYTNVIVNARNTILDFNYGSDNYDASKMIKTAKGHYSFIDVKHVNDCLNSKLEFDNWNNN